MKLSTLYTTVPEYIEFAWVTAPNAQTQIISENTVTRLTIDTEVADTGNLVSAPNGSQFALPAGTYYFEALTQLGALMNGRNIGAIFSLFNVSDSNYISRVSSAGSSLEVITHGGQYDNFSYFDKEKVTQLKINGQFIISSNKIFELRILTNISSFVCSAVTAFTNSTAGADQRTTIKLWKLK